MRDPGSPSSCALRCLEPFQRISKNLRRFQRISSIEALKDLGRNSKDPEESWRILQKLLQGSPKNLWWIFDESNNNFKASWNDFKESLSSLWRIFDESWKNFKESSANLQKIFHHFQRISKNLRRTSEESLMNRWWIVDEPFQRIFDKSLKSLWRTFKNISTLPKNLQNSKNLFDGPPKNLQRIFDKSLVHLSWKFSRTHSQLEHC